MSDSRLVFRDLITGSNTNGHQFICKGEFEVIIDLIPTNAPTDWEMGPKMRPGEYGAYRAHGFYACGHGPYAFATGKDAATCETQAAGHFLGGYVRWPRLTSQQRLAGEDGRGRV